MKARKWISKALALSFILHLGGAIPTSAAPSGSDDETGADAAPSAGTSAKGSPRKQTTKGGKRNREKEADGTEAADRFEADTVIKSQYRFNGQPLEVDPD